MDKAIQRNFKKIFRASFFTEWSNTWNTVSKLCQKLSKLWRVFSSLSLKLNFPPKTYSKNKHWRNKSTVCVFSHRYVFALNLPACPEEQRWRWKEKAAAAARRLIVSSSVERRLNSIVISNICKEKKITYLISRISKLRVFRNILVLHRDVKYRCVLIL